MSEENVELARAPSSSGLTSRSSLPYGITMRT
jgi:hypothetical protein